MAVEMAPPTQAPPNHATAEDGKLKVSPAKASSVTYTTGMDGGALAARAKQLGLDRAHKERSDNHHDHHHEKSGSLFVSLKRVMMSQANIDLISAMDPEVDEYGSFYNNRLVSRSDSNISELVGETEVDEHGVPQGSSLLEAGFAVTKGAVSAATLYMPNGFREGGVGFSIPMMLMCYSLFMWCSTCLLEAWAKHPSSHAGLMGAATGRVGNVLIRLIVVCQQCGICLTYFIFVATNMREVVQYTMGVDVSLESLCVIQIFFFAPLTWIRDIQLFKYTNLIGNFLVMYSLIVISSYAVSMVADGTAAIESPGVNSGLPGAWTWGLPVFNKNEFYLFIGTSAFMYEGSAALMIPLQESIRHDQAHKFPAIFVKVLGAILCTYIAFALINWKAYGDYTQTVLTVNLPDGPWKVSVQIAYSLAQLFTFPLAIFPAVKILKRVCKIPIAKAKQKKYQNLDSMESNDAPGIKKDPLTPLEHLRAVSGRTLLVVILAMIAICMVDSLARVVSLLGALLGIPLGFIIPLIIHLKLVPESSPLTKLFNWTALLLGLGMSITCTAITLKTW